MTDFKAPQSVQAAADAAELPIVSFSGEFRFLSNFFPAEVMYGGQVYPSSEHAFQAAKTRNPHERDYIRAAASPAIAKARGRESRLREDWDDLKVEIMEKIVYDKFTRNPELREKLLATGDRELIEGNSWGDDFWGVVNGHGLNMLGKILMRTRAHIRELG